MRAGLEAGLGAAKGVVGGVSGVYGCVPRSYNDCVWALTVGHTVRAAGACVGHGGWRQTLLRGIRALVVELSTHTHHPR